MRRWHVITAALALLFVVAALLPAAAARSGDATPTTYVLVAADDGSLPAGLAQQVAARGGSIVFSLPQIGVAVASSADAGFAAGAWSIAGLQAVVPDLTFTLDTADVGNPPTSGDDDRYFDMQWALDAIDAPEAWNMGARGAGARVAVLDAGIDSDHPDLAPNLNTALDRSFVDCDRPEGCVPVEAGTPPGGFNKRPHHGTWVAGIIAAADNGIGTIGVAPQAELVAVRVCRDDLRVSCSFSAVLAGIVYAADIDADVINMSLQGWLPRSGGYDSHGTYFSARDVQEWVVALTRALAYAHRQGTLSVAAAGNDHHDLDTDADRVYLPAGLPNTLAVAATGPRGWATDPSTNLDVPACYTNYGRSVIDLAAPGGNIDGTCVFPLPPPWSYCTVVVTLPCFAFDAVVGPTVYSPAVPGTGWSENVGTSAAAPHVSGVAALVIGAHGGTMDPDAVEAILRASADDLGAPGVDPYYGSGRVNAAKAVSTP